MSDTRHATQNRKTRDRGLTLPELLVVMVVIGLITTSLAAAVSVTLRTSDNTEGRLNVARGEQSLASWVPPDLSSAETVNTDPAGAPCGADCPAGFEVPGSNALLLTWTTKQSNGAAAVDVVTTVSYRYTYVDGEYQLIRLECITVDSGLPTCTSNVVLHDLLPPPNGENFIPGVTEPWWVIQVSEPLAPDAVDEGDVAGEDYVKDANRVVVTITGGGDGAGAGGGVNQISITAGGTNRTTIDAASVEGAPSFTEARSRCGGPLTLVVDESNSVGSAVDDVEDAVEDFVRTFAGTPVQLQIVRFQTYASILGDSSWSRYFDMTDDADVTALLNSVSDLQGSWSGQYPLGGTNWEDALFRVFYKEDGTTADVIPNTMVFFTDGVPTFNRIADGLTVQGTIPALPAPLEDPWPEATGSGYNQESFNRANYIASQFRSSVRFVGVGVGSGIDGSSEWLSSPETGYHLIWERGYHQYMRGYDWVWSGYWWKDYSGPNGYNYWEWTTKEDWEANDTPDPWWEDGYWDQGYKSHSSPYMNWYEVSSGGSGSSYRSTKVYAEPYDYYDEIQSDTVSNKTILARLIAGNDFGVEAILDGGVYTNAEEADMFVDLNWDQMDEALEAIALGECGGTLTLQTRIDGTTSAPDPFTYQNTSVLDSNGDPLDVEPTVVTTSQSFTTGTFDFTIPNSQYVTVDIIPQNLSDLSGYTPNGWSCRLRGADHPAYSEIPIVDSAFTGIRLDISSNEAVSCTLSVSLAP